MTKKTPPQINEDARKKIVHLLRACGPCTRPEIREELLTQCAGVHANNVFEVCELAATMLHVKNVIEWDSDNCSYDINPFMYSGDGSTWVGPKEYDFS